MKDTQRHAETSRHDLRRRKASAGLTDNRLVFSQHLPVFQKGRLRPLELETYFLKKIKNKNLFLSSHAQC